LGDTKSILTLYRRLLELRREQPSLSFGSYSAIPAQGDLLAYRRQFEGAARYLVVLNCGPDAAVYNDSFGHAGKVAVSTHLDRRGEPVQGQIDLRGNEGLVIELADE
jgi:alpha-glucosidase